jgi:hypothetical protein
MSICKPMQQQSETCATFQPLVIMPNTSRHQRSANTFISTVYQFLGLLVLITCITELIKSIPTVFIAFNKTREYLYRTAKCFRGTPSGSKNKPSNKPAWSKLQAKPTNYYLLHAGFLSGLLFDPEDGGDIFLRNVGWLSTDYMALYPRRQNFKCKMLSFD